MSADRYPMLLARALPLQDVRDRRATTHAQRAMHKVQRATYLYQRISLDPHRSIHNAQPTMRDLQCSTYNPQRITYNPLCTDVKLALLSAFSSSCPLAGAGPASWQSLSAFLRPAMSRPGVPLPAERVRAFTQFPSLCNGHPWGADLDLTRPNPAERTLRGLSGSKRPDPATVIERSPERNRRLPSAAPSSRSSSRGLRLQFRPEASCIGSYLLISLLTVGAWCRVTVA